MTQQQQAFSFTASADRLINRLFSPCFVSDAWSPGGSEPEPPRMEFRALWDTGATRSHVSKKVVEVCGLEPEDFIKEAHHAYGTTENVPVFYVNFLLPNRVRFEGIPVIQLGSVVGADVLIGMDIIGTGDFAVTNIDGKTKFSFRFPSSADIDFVAEDNERIRKKRERNRTEELLKSKGSSAFRSSKSGRRRRKSRSK